jgi:hypothetical protein
VFQTLIIENIIYLFDVIYWTVWMNTVGVEYLFNSFSDQSKLLEIFVGVECRFFEWSTVFKVDDFKWEAIWFRIRFFPIFRTKKQNFDKYSESLRSCSKKFVQKVIFSEIKMIITWNFWNMFILWVRFFYYYSIVHHLVNEVKQIVFMDHNLVLIKFSNK